ncbi:unnamed protein product [Effrenium voratum]|uniref:Poly [ADP-ribose] polymerase n=1 Tax=Effrenium voratum TaxID=2562239 RepID=A0AA36ITP7_9DINO|nr:unnamed protein product [Effrenium voratum]
MKGGAYALSRIHESWACSAGVDLVAPLSRKMKRKGRCFRCTPCSRTLDRCQLEKHLEECHAAAKPSSEGVEKHQAKRPVHVRAEGSSPDESSSDESSSDKSSSRVQPCCMTSEMTQTSLTWVTDHDYLQVSWEFKAKGSGGCPDWQPYAPTTCKELEAHFQAFKGGGPEQVTVSTNGFSYSIMLSGMKQTNLETKRERSIRRSDKHALGPMLSERGSSGTLCATCAQLGVFADSVQAERDGWQERCSKLHGECNELREERNVCNEHRSELEEELFDLHERADWLQESLSWIEEERDSLAERCLALQAERDKFESECAALRESKFQLEKAKNEQQRLLKLGAEELKRLQGELGELQLRPHHSQQMKLQECWRARAQPGKMRYRVPATDPVVEFVREALRAACPTSHHSECERMRTVRVCSVEQIQNVELWGKYEFHKDCIRKKLSTLPASHKITTNQALSRACRWAELDTNINEVFALHGTKTCNVDKIVKYGFDERLARQGGLYGQGTYFTDESCKSLQYTEARGGRGAEGCIILSRVVLGYPHLATNPLPHLKSEPLRDEADESKGASRVRCLQPLSSLP